MMFPSFNRIASIIGACSLIAFNAANTAEACSVIEPGRAGAYIVEESIRTTSDPSKLVALLGQYNQTQETFWETRDPVSVQNITIDVTTGDVYLGLPQDVTVNEPLESSQPSKNYTVEAGSSGDSAVLSGPDLAQPFAFDYSRPSDQGRLENLFVYSDKLERGYYFYNGRVEGAETLPSGEPIPSVSSGGPSNTEPVVAIMDLSNPDDVSSSTFHYTGRPTYFNGPARNMWDQIQVVELRENGADCFQSAYFHYNESAVRLVGFKQYTRSSMNFNAISMEDDGSFVYNVVNVLPMSPRGMTPETPESYKIVKMNIATGEKTDIALNHVLEPLPQPMNELSAASSAGTAWDSVSRPLMLLVVPFSLLFV